MPKIQIKSLGKSGRVSRVKARAVAKAMKAHLVAPRKGKAIPSTVTVKRTATGKGLISFRAGKIHTQGNRHPSQGKRGRSGPSKAHD
jgi:hypothetical protein